MEKTDKSEYVLSKIYYGILATLILTVFVWCFISCATMIEAQKPFSEMTTKEKTVYLLSMYNKQYDEYLSLYQKGEHTEEEKEILRTKYELLKEINPYIGLYVTYSENGEIPNDLIEKKLIDLINKTLQN